MELYKLILFEWIVIWEHVNRWKRPNTGHSILSLSQISSDIDVKVSSSINQSHRFCQSMISCSKCVNSVVFVRSQTIKIHVYIFYILILNTRLVSSPYAEVRAQLLWQGSIAHWTEYHLNWKSHIINSDVLNREIALETGTRRESVNESMRFQHSCMSSSTKTYNKDLKNWAELVK